MAFGEPQWWNCAIFAPGARPVRVGERKPQEMKPTLQFNPQSTKRQRSPLTEYHYRSALNRSGASARKVRAARDVRGFWKLSAGFFGIETKIDYVMEFALFGVLSALSVWPIVEAFQALGRLIRN